MRGDVLDGVSPGSTLGGRYSLRRRLDDELGAQRWLAQDTTLARQVEICVLPDTHPRADAVLDAARRAAGVTDQRLVRVLDAVSEDGLTLVVTEWTDGTTLTDLVRRNPMPADEARTLVGEASLALEQARHRGLHHRCLTTEHVLRLDDGSIKVAGVAVEAALHGLEGDDGDAASRDDTLALVGLAYAALTGFWPSPRRTVRTDPGSGPIRIGSRTTPPVLDASDPAAGPSWRPPLLPPAPQIAGAAVAPAQIVSGVPADLDTLCVQAFAGPGAPDTPGHLAGQIAPWGDSVRPDRVAGTFPLALGPVASVPPARADSGTGPVGPPSARPDAPVLARRGLESPGPPAPADDPPTTDAASRPDPSSGTTRPTVTPGTAARPDGPSATGTDPAELGPPTARLPRLPHLRPPADQPGADQPDWGDLFDDHVEPPAPLLPPTPLNRPPRNQTRTVIILVAAFLLVMLLLAKCGLSGLGDNAFIKNAPRPSSTATGSPTTPASTPSTGPTGDDATGGPVRIVAARGFDPQGDGSEKDSTAARAIDGDPATAWYSDAYKSAQWGGLKKGVGLRLDLGEPTIVHQVKLTVPDTGANVELRTVTGDDLSGSVVVAKADDVSGTVTLTPTTPPTTRYLVVWFTTPAPSKDGYRAAVSEVSVS